MGVDVDEDNHVFVADRGTHQIVQFDEFGNSLKFFGSDWLDNPTGLEIDLKGNVFVVDSGHDRVVCFSASGYPVGSTYGDDIGFTKPADLAVSFEGELFVTDTGRDRILKFTIFY